MLKKKYRLRAIYVKKLLNTKKFFHSKLFIIKYAKNNLKINRYAICISNKITKKSVLRNKIRRKFYYIIKQNNNNFLLTHYDFLFVLKNNTKVNKENINNYINDLHNDIKYFFNTFKF